MRGKGLWVSWLLSGSLVWAAPVDITARYSVDATEATTGVFLPVSRASVDNSSFAYLRYLMRPVVLSGGTPGTTVRLESSDATTFEVYTTAGVRMTLPTTIAASSLPMTLYVYGARDGQSKLALSDNSSKDIILFKVGGWPGIAGRRLNNAPFFEYVRAINDNDIVSAAVDPTRMPDRIGQQPRVHLVKHRSPKEWGVDNTLQDITADGIETLVIASGSTSNNRVNIWTTGVSGNAGTELGVALDVVLDFGNDGRLDPGDLIDDLNVDEAGIYVVDDVLVPGPYATASFDFDDSCLFTIPPFQMAPTYCARSRGHVVHPNPLPKQRPLPLVVFSHGATFADQSFRGYDYMQQLLASNGFITVGLDMFPAQDAAASYDTDPYHRAWLTLKNIERMVLQTAAPRNYPPMGGGVLEPGGRSVVDGKRIVISGHSRGGEGVVLASAQLRHLFDPAHPFPAAIVPSGETLLGFDKVLGVHDIAGTNFNTVANGNTPLNTPYLLTWGTLDRDVRGDTPEVQPSRRYHRATGVRAAHMVYTAQHGCFNQFWDYDCTEAPWYSSQDQTRRTVKGSLYPWIQWVVNGSRPALDFLTRNTTIFRAIGTQDIPWRLATRLSHATYESGFVIDDFETNVSPALSSSGGAVTFSSLVSEEDATWWEGRHVRLTYSGNSQFYTQAIVATARDWRDYRYLSLAVGQEWVGANDIAFSITLRDLDGHASTISSSEYGPVHLNDQYFVAPLRTKPQIYRFRLTDFNANGTGVDLSRVADVKLEFGANHGSGYSGDVVIDDIELVANKSLD